MANSATLYVLLFLWLGMNVADGFWMYYFVRTSVYPVPHNPIDKTHSGFIGFEVMMFFYGFCVGCINGWVAIGYLGWTAEQSKSNSRSGSSNLWLNLFNFFIAFPVFGFLIFMPFFGGWVVTPIVQKHAWEHGCDSYPMYAILDGKAQNSATTTKNVVYFFEQGSKDAMYTYELSNPGDGDIWSLHLREFDTEQSAIPLDLYPTLQLVQYDFVNETVTANCTTPASDNSTTSTGCLTGTFDNNSPLYLNLTSSVPLNNTSNATAVPQTTTVLRSQDARWFYKDQAPSLILRELVGDTLGRSVLQTTVNKVSDCTELKVCVTGTGAQLVVGAEVMAPLGLMLLKQADYSLYCTDNSD